MGLVVSGRGQGFHERGVQVLGRWPGSEGSRRRQGAVRGDREGCVRQGSMEENTGVNLYDLGFGHG